MRYSKGFRRRRAPSESAEMVQAVALDRAKNGTSMANYPAIYSGFMAKGIPESEIHPRVNTFTYEAWKAKGRQVRKGEKGVRVVTFLEGEKDEKGADGSVKKVAFKRPWSTVVFHVSQTDPIKASVGEAPKLGPDYTAEGAWLASQAQG